MNLFKMIQIQTADLTPPLNQTTTQNKLMGVHDSSKQLLKHVTHAIDLHTGAIHRTNLPQIRAELDNPVALEMAKAFGAPEILDSTLRDGSLRASANEDGIPLILYEAGEGLRLDETAIRAGASQAQLLGTQRAGRAVAE